MHKLIMTGGMAAVALCIALPTQGDVICSGESAEVSVDSRGGTEPLDNTVNLPWDASWIGGDVNATVVIADNGMEVKRATGTGEFSLGLSGAGRHELTYTTYIDGVRQDEVYAVTVFNEWKYEVEDGGAVIVDTTRHDGNVTIPSELDGYPVTKLADGVFSGCDELMNIAIPGSVTNIGASAFVGCSGLESVHIVDLAKWCGISFGSPDANPLYYAHDLYLNGEKVTELTIPDGMTSIEAYAFCNCSNITTVVIPDSVKHIGISAFSGCTAIRHVTMPQRKARSGLRQARFNTRFDTESTLDDANGVADVSGVIAAYTKVTASPWEFADPLTGDTFAWNESNTTFAYFGQMYMEAGKTYVFGAHFDDDAYVKVDGQVLINVKDSSTYSLYTGSYVCSASGWHDVDIRLGDNTGGKGSWGSKWSSDFGLGYRDDGGTSEAQSGWKPLLDPGDGSLFRGSEQYTLQSLFPDAYDKVTNVTLTCSSTDILPHAFDGCVELTDVTIQGSVTNIGDSAFAGCINLTSIAIPDSVTSIGDGAFSGCVSLTELAIPDGVASIGDYAFCDCSGLESVAVPDSVINSIGISAFAGCTAIRHVTMPQRKARSGLRQARFNTRFDTESTLDDANDVAYVSGVIAAYTKVTASPWEFADPLTGDTFAWNESNSTFAYFGQMYMEAGKTYVFGAHFDDDAYVKVDGQVMINVKNSGNYSLYTGSYVCSTSGWHDVDIRLGDNTGGKGSWGSKWSSDFGLGYRDDGGTSTAQSDWKPLLDPGDGSLFRGSEVRYMLQMSDIFPDAYDKVTNVTLTGSSTDIPPHAFAGCVELMDVTIPGSVTNIGASAFSGCVNLTNISIPDGVTSVGNGAFNGCSGLESVHIADLAKWCGISFGSPDANPLYYAHDLYLNGEKVTELAIPDGVTCIEDYAFSDCSNITSITIPDSVQGIGESAFKNCASLTNVVFVGDLPTFGDYAFYGDFKDFCGNGQSMETV